MKNVNVIVLTIDEIRHGLVEFYVKLLKDESYTRDALKNECMHFDFKNMSDDELVNTYAELCVGEYVLLNHEGDLVVYEKLETGDLIFLANRKQMYNNQPLPLTVDALKGLI